jgi:hypothetical protein
VDILDPRYSDTELREQLRAFYDWKNREEYPAACAYCNWSDKMRVKRGAAQAKMPVPYTRV